MTNKTDTTDKKKAPKKATKKTTPKKTAKKKAASKNKTKKAEVLPKEPEKKFKFKAKDGTLTSIPMIGKVNIVELRQENRTDFLFTRLPKELAIKYSTGRVKTKYDITVGDLCIIATKYRGDAIDASNPTVVSECYTLLFCPHFGVMSADLEFIGEGVADEDIKMSLLALDESKGLHWRNKYLVEKELREKGRDYKEKKGAGIRESATRMAATIVDDVALGDRAVEEDVSLFNMGTAGQWLQKNWLFVLLSILGILVVLSFFGGG